MLETTKAIVLAGGKSTRLYPLTLATPKPLVPVAGEANLSHVLRYLRAHGIRDVAISICYHADQVVRHFGDGSTYGVRLTYLREREALGSAGATVQMRDHLDGGGTFVVVACDLLTDLDLSALVASHQERLAMATIALVHADDVTQYGVVRIDRERRILEFQEKPARGEERSHLVNTGIYVLDKSIFRYIPRGVIADFAKDVFPALLNAGERFYGYPSSGYWCDIGTPEEYRRATRDALAGTIALYTDGAPRIHPSARISLRARLEGDVKVGAFTQVGPGVHIVGPTAIGEHCVIEDDARLRACILWNRVRVGASATLEQAILADGSEIAPFATVSAEALAAVPCPRAS